MANRLIADGDRTRMKERHRSIERENKWGPTEIETQRES